jgi:lipoprotein-anchoring transpeptidase ErfK/SrfK
MTQVEQKLADLHYDVGPVDGTYDDQTRSAVMAFQKVYGLERTGNLTDPVTAQLMATSTNPPPLVPGDTAANKVEIDLRRQVLFLYEGGALSKILAVSTGTAKTPTPTGDFRIYSQSKGWETSPLGRLYNSQYFVGGYAIHGSPSVPAEPASHGCVRLTMSAAEWFPQQVTIGTPVHVLAG